MEKRRVVTINDYQRLIGLIEMNSINKTQEITDRLLNELKVAKMLPQEGIAKGIVTMNSRLLLREVAGHRETEVTITYPEEANSKARKVSILSQVGAALLGCHEGDVVSWPTPTGIGRFKIVNVTYQPEAAGDFYL